MSHTGRFVARSQLAARELSAGSLEKEYLAKLSNILATQFLSEPRHYEFSTFLLGAISVFELVASPRRSERTLEQIRLDGHDSISAQLVIDGAADGTAGRLNWQSTPGTVMMLDFAQPFVVIDREPRHVINVAFARHLFAPHLDDVARLHGTVIPADRAAMFATHLHELAQRIDVIPISAAAAFGTILLELLLVALGITGTADQTRHERLRARANTIIDARLASRSLTPAVVAAALGVSRAELYRSFATEGGVEKVIRNRRLAAARRLLENPDANHKRIGEVAELHGFSGASHFARSFKELFGITPTSLTRHQTVPE